MGGGKHQVLTWGQYGVGKVCLEGGVGGGTYDNIYSQ